MGLSIKTIKSYGIQGFSMLEVLISAGLLSVVAITVTQLTGNVVSVGKGTVGGPTDLSSLVNQLNAWVGSEASCKAMLAGAGGLQNINADLLKIYSPAPGAPVFLDASAADNGQAPRYFSTLRMDKINLIGGYSYAPGGATAQAISIVNGAANVYLHLETSRSTGAVGPSPTPGGRLTTVTEDIGLSVKVDGSGNITDCGPLVFGPSPTAPYPPCPSPAIHPIDTVIGANQFCVNAGCLNPGPSPSNLGSNPYTGGSMCCPATSLTATPLPSPPYPYTCAP